MTTFFDFKASDLFQPEVRQVTEDDSTWNILDVGQPIIFQCTDPRVTIWYRPVTEGNSAKPASGGYTPSRGGICVFNAPGRWAYLVKVLTAGSPADRTFLLNDARIFVGGMLDAMATGQPIPRTITMDAPTTASVAATSAEAVAASTNRTFVYLKNTSTGGQRISIAFGAAAVLDSGITLAASESIVIDINDGCASSQIRAIASAASASLAVQTGS